MTLDPRTPVIVGVGQVSVPTPNPEDPAEPIALMAEAVRSACRDAGTDGFDTGVDLVGVVGGTFSYRDPAALVASQAGLTDVDTILTSWGGETPVAFAAELAARIRRGQIGGAVMVGGETNATRRALRKLGIRTPKHPETDGPGPEPWGTPLDMGSPIDVERGAEHPRNTYAVLDSAIRAHRGETLDQARDRAAGLWSRFAAVAASNPHAADRRSPTAEEIREPDSTNRMVSWPYTKALCANNQVDQAGAVLMTSVEVADRLGVPGDRRVYPLETILATDSTSLLTRRSVHHVPGLAAACARLVEARPIDEIVHLDLYGCFPSIVTLTSEYLGAEDDRQLTVTGGLGFMGAPMNFAAGQSLIAMVQVLRDDPGSVGLVQGNGGHATKHALTTFSTNPSPRAIPSDRIVHPPVNEVADPMRSGEVVIDGVTVEYDREGPQRALAICRFADDSRLWANSSDPTVMEVFVTDEWVGRSASVSAGSLHL